jgi:hypothetical protein
VFQPGRCRRGATAGGRPSADCGDVEAADSGCVDEARAGCGASLRRKRAADNMARPQASKAKVCDSGTGSLTESIQSA